jgi:glycosyltransferase involved in cell wall biosynthesis
VKAYEGTEVQIKVVRFPCYFEKGKLFYLEYNIRLLFWLLFHRWDGVIGADLDSVFPCWLSARLLGRRVGYDAHEYFTEVPEVVNRPFTRGVWDMVAKICVPRVDACMTVGPVLAKVLSGRYKAHFDVVRNVPYKSEVTPALVIPQKDEAIVLLYQGALNEGRGLEEAIQAMQFLPSRFVLQIAGEGDLSKELRALAKELGLSDKVRFLGMLTPEELREVTKRCHFGLNLLQNISQNYYYSLANKFFDYIQAGKPSLGMAFPEYELICGEYKVALLVSTLDPKEIAQKVQDCFEHEESYLRFHNECVRAADEFHWGKEKELFKIFLQKVLNI